MTFKRLNNIFGWVAGIIAFIVYLLTMEPTVSWWDCGEYISTAYKLQVGHPPGAPLFQLLGRFFSLFAFGDVTKVAMMINMMSCLCSGLTITFLFWTITLLARKIWMKEGEDSPWNNKIGVLIAAFVGCMAYTFTESFWFNAVEGEVYAMSSFFTAVTFWAILKWEQVADEPHSYRWIIFIAYLIGLSIGVHLLNLLCIPAFVFVVYFRKWEKTTFGGFLLAGLVSLVLLWFLNMVLVPQVVNLAGKTELFFVNTLHLPFNSGAIFYFSLLTILIVVGLLLTIKYKKVIWNTIVLSLLFILIGYSSFFMLAIRANTNTPINENEPKDALSMLSYLNREQYGSWPLLYGPYYNAYIDRQSYLNTGQPYQDGLGKQSDKIRQRAMQYTDGKPTYVKGKEVNEKGKEVDRYIITSENKNSVPKYPSEFNTIFPRMWSSSSDNHIETYLNYRKNKAGEITGNKLKEVHVKEGGSSTTIRLDSTVVMPTFGQNLKFFVDYQCNWMYWRYFLWNFAGRQNNIEGQRGIQYGNWISGINALDSNRLGDQRNIPDVLKNPGRTQFYFLPLLLGLAGLFWLLSKSTKQSWIVFLLFFMTGLAIVIYLNQTPYQPRERDYSYAGSFYAFAIWIGFGVLALIDWINRLTKSKSMVTNIAVGAVCLLVVPGLMASQGWEEHNRHGKTSARDWARNYLAQLPPNAVIFTRGDNDTFPLWYIQEVEGFRTDVRVCNFMLASGYWYVHQMGRKVYDSEKLPMTLPFEEYENGINEYLPVFGDANGRYYDLKEVIEYIPKTQVDPRLGYNFKHYFPTRNLKLKVDKEACIRNGIVPEEMQDQMVDEIRWTVRSSYVYKNALFLLDFMASNNWERPVYFTSFNDVASVLGIDKYLYMEGLSYRFIPVEVDSKDYRRNYGGVYRKGSYDLLVNKAQWGNMNTKGVVPDRESMRNVDFARQSYIRLAKSHILYEENDSAVVVMDTYQKFFPNEKFPFGTSLYQFPEMYYSCNELQKGDEFMRKLMKNCCDKVDYFGNMKPKFADEYKDIITEQILVMDELQQAAKKYKRTELLNELNDILPGYRKQFKRYLGSDYFRYLEFMESL